MPAMAVPELVAGECTQCCYQLLAAACCSWFLACAFLLCAALSSALPNPFHGGPSQRRPPSQRAPIGLCSLAASAGSWPGGGQRALRCRSPCAGARRGAGARAGAAAAMEATGPSARRGGRWSARLERPPHSSSACIPRAEGGCRRRSWRSALQLENFGFIDRDPQIETKISRAPALADISRQARRRMDAQAPHGEGPIPRGGG